ncbi:cytochrome c biogenesis protein CcsA [Cellulosimicrobium sp. NPDC057127]|uniref:cytochrome c biogenesis protein CcsA n=1 Tax=Cellulosimicrobium sp. NPDC057127 TaxID=3346026 RepID=UPI00363487D5
MTPLRLLAAATAVAAVVAVVLGAAAPPDAVQGDAQRWMYVHVPAAWGAYACFAVVLLASLRVAARDTPRSLRLATAAAEVGVVLTAVTLATGSVWGALTWGTWWVWDARVSSTVAMGLVYAGFLAARSLAATSRARRVVGVLGVAGFLVVPVVHMSVVWWRTLHQPPTIMAPGTTAPIDPSMAAALVAALVAVTLGAALAVLLRVRRAARPRPDDAGRPGEDAEALDAGRPDARVPARAPVAGGAGSR